MLHLSTVRTHIESDLNVSSCDFEVYTFITITDQAYQQSVKTTFYHASLISFLKMK